MAIDEVKLVTFDNINEMRSIMQGYMERGRFNVDGYDGESFAGVVLLGNISIENMDEYTSMFSELPVLFQESALVDRIHGFIKGWDIPKMQDNLLRSMEFTEEEARAATPVSACNVSLSVAGTIWTIVSFGVSNF